MTGLPTWLVPLPDAEAMRAVDRWAIEERGVPSLELMERAGVGVAAAVERLCPDGPVTVVCGKGNNGGDGLVVARLLRQAGRPVTVVCASSPEELSGDAAANLERLPGSGPVGLDGAAWRDGDEPATISGDGAAAIVDAVLGTGFAGTPHGSAAAAIETIGRMHAPVVSVDVPSGVDASTGEVAGAAVSAAITVTFHAGKPGLWIYPGKGHAGDVETLDIGIPRGAPVQAAAGLVADEVAASLPRRTPTWTKFDSGQVLVVGGSRGLSGAPAMAARASMRAGAGYVTACVPASLQPVLASDGTPELMTRAMPEDDAGGLAPEALDPILQAAARGGAIALGPGLGRSEGSFELVRQLTLRAEAPLVLDADGLGAFAGRLPELSARGAPTVLTPHAGELARLLELDSAEIERRRLVHVRKAARLSGAIVVLKGDDSLIADPSGLVAVSPGATPALATAGTGDVLTGVIAALMAQRVGAFPAAAAGVRLHARAGVLAAQKLGAIEGVIATDVIAALPRARACLLADTGE